MSTRKIWWDKIEWYVTNSYLCIWFHFHEIHLYTCSCTIPGYCYTQHSHHSCVFRQHIRPSLENQKRRIFCTEPAFMFLSRVLWCCCFPFVSFNWFLRSYSQLFYFCCIVTMLPPVPWLHIPHINRRTTHNSPTCSDEGLALDTSDFKLAIVAYFTSSTHLIQLNYLCS